MRLAEGTAHAPEFLVPGHLLRESESGDWLLLCRDELGEVASDGRQMPYQCTSCGSSLRSEFRARRIDLTDIPERWRMSLIMA
jgi:hypothetical protein